MAAIDVVGGIGETHARRFRRSGIRTTEAFLRRAVSIDGRRELAASLSVDEQDLLDLAFRIELMSIRGVGARYAKLLSAAGVGTAEELRTRNPETLHALIVQINDRKKVVHRLPKLDRVMDWVAEARTVESAIHL